MSDSEGSRKQTRGCRFLATRDAKKPSSAVFPSICCQLRQQPLWKSSDVALRSCPQNLASKSCISSHLCTDRLRKTSRWLLYAIQTWPPLRRPLTCSVKYQLAQTTSEERKDSTCSIATTLRNNSVACNVSDPDIEKAIRPAIHHELALRQ